MTTVSAPTAEVTAVPVDLAAPDAQSSGHDTSAPCRSPSWPGLSRAPHERARQS